jgi:DNA-binding transcriptional MerR regulator
LSDARRSIGDVVEQLAAEFPDLTISKVRYLEREGLVSPERAASGYRRYSDQDVAQLRWVLRRQRERFLPLRVIAEELDRGDFVAAATSDDASPDGDHRPAIETRPLVDRLRSPVARTWLTPSELRRRSGLASADLEALEQAGLIQVEMKDNRPVFGDHAIAVVEVAARFMQAGLEPRHLKTLKLAADREAGLLQQRVAGLGTEARQATLGELLHLADELRALLLRAALQPAPSAVNRGSRGPARR